MPVRPVLKIGHPILAEVAQKVTEFNTSELDSLIVDLRDTMHHLNGAGIAAPQIGVSKQVLIFEMKDNPRYPGQEVIPETVLINPAIDVLTEETQGMWEGCLSVPGMRGYVERPTYIRYRAFDQYGNRIDKTVTGFHAIVVQHECDHLQGVLYPQRLQDLSKFGFEEDLLLRQDYP